jgi:hypothetical protein
MGADTREPMVDLPSHGVSFALLQGQLLAGEISRSAFLDRASPLGAGTSEAAAVADKVLAIAANKAARQKDLKSRRVAGGRRLEPRRPMVRPERPCRQHERHVLNSEAPARVAPTGQTQGELA